LAFLRGLSQFAGLLVTTLWEMVGLVNLTVTLPAFWPVRLGKLQQ
jgi:hypothetical protein